MENTERENKYFRAKNRVEQIKKFHLSLFSYVFFILFLAGLNYWVNQWSNPWFLWAAFGWGIGILFHALKTYGSNLFLGKHWEEKKIKEIMNQDTNNKKWG